MLNHPILRIPILGLLLLGFHSFAWSCDAGDESALSTCISGSDSEINITADITLTSEKTIGRAVIINGAGYTIQGADSFRLLTINATSSSDEIVLNDLTLIDGNSSGGASTHTCGSTGKSGGAICKESGSSLVINRSVFRSNTGVRGGALYIKSTSGDVGVYNSVFIGNSSTYGAGLYITSTGNNTNIEGCTITGNTAATSGAFSGGGIFSFSGSANIKNSIIAGNIGITDKENCNRNGGSFTSEDYNIVGDDTHCPSSGTNDQVVTSTSDIFDTAPTLKNDVSNPALDAIASGTNDCGTSPFDEDYLGTTRPLSSSCDIGAHELNADSTAPTFDGTETKIDNASVSDTDTEFDIIAQIDETGTVYYVILGSSETAPDASQVEAGTDSSDSAVSLSGSFAISTADTPTTESITSGLTASTSYTIYLVAKDGSSNVSSVMDLDHTTTDTIAPTITASTSNIGDTSFDLTMQLNELGTVYYVVVTNGSGEPSTTQIASGQNSSGSSAITSSTVSISTADTDVTESISSLDPATDYDVYLYAEDDESTSNPTSIELYEITTTSDIAAPVFNKKETNTETGSSFDITIQLDEIGTVYYVVVTNSTGEPSKSQIKAGNDATGSTAVDNGTINANTANSDETVTISSLSYNTDYDIYLYAEDDESSPNESNIYLLEATTIPDTTAPSFSSSSTSNIGSSSVDVTIEVDESSTIYYVVVADGDSSPTATEVKNGESSGGGSPVASGNFDATADTSTTETISGLDSQTAYDIYFVAEDSSSNLSDATQLNATTATLTYTVSVSKSGTGDGTTSGYGSYESGASVSLTASADSNSKFSGWSGDSECNSSFTMPSSNVSCTAKFTKTTTTDDNSSTGTIVEEPVYHNLLVNITGKGSFSSDTVGISCSIGNNCVTYREYLTVTLTPEPDQGYRLKSWSGDCSKSGIVVMDSKQTCQLTFEKLPAYQLVTQKSGKGFGTISSNDGIINCGSACRSSYTADRVITLTATVDSDKTQFVGWSCVDGLSTTDSSIEIAMSQNRTCTAGFSTLYSLTTYVDSAGGTISYEQSLACSADNSPCVQNYPEGIMQLTSTPDLGYVAIWSAECPEGQINLNSDQTCHVSFTPSYTLALQVIGNGAITSNPSGIDCQTGGCSASYIQGETIQLIATPEFGHSFVGWTGDCSNGQTTLNMDSDKICTATFANTGSPQFAQDIYATTEKENVAIITVNRVEGSNGEMSVIYLVGNNTATYPQDYKGTVSGTLTWADGDLEPKTFEIEIVTDPYTELVETARMQIINQTNTVLDEAELQITDTVLPANINLVHPNITASDQDEVLVIPVSRSVTFTGIVQADFVVTVGGNILTQGTVSWADNEITNQLIQIPIGAVPIGSTTLETTISNPQPDNLVALGAKTSTVLSLTKTPVSGEVNFKNVEFQQSEGQIAIIEVERTGAIDTEASIYYELLDGTATPSTDYSGIANTLIWAAGENSVKTFDIKIEADAIQEDVETVNLRLSKPVGTILGATSNAVLQIIDVAATPTTDNTQPPIDPEIPVLPPEPLLGVVEFEQTEYIVNENDGRVTVKIVRTPETTGTINVQISTQDGNAISGRDYTVINKRLTWVNADTQSQEIQIGLLDNATSDGNRTFIIELTNTSQVDMVGEKSIAQVIIFDNDINQVRFETDSYRIDEDEREVVLSVIRAGGLDAASISYRTNTDGTATFNLDFTKTSGQLNWQAGDTRSQNITIPIINDTTIESNETFTVGLFVTDGKTQMASPRSATVTIKDDDKGRTKPVVNPDTGNTLVNGQVSNQDQLIGGDGKSTFINPDGSISNSTLAGNIESEGVLEDVVLTAGTTITGGTIQGSVAGAPESPAILKNVTIESGTKLDNVIIGRGSTVADDVILGENVRFTDNTVIPALYLDKITGHITPPEAVQTFFGVFAVNLLNDVITNPSINGILGSINGLQEFVEYGVSMQQDTVYGILVLKIGSIAYPLLPVQLSQVLPNQLRDNKPYVGLHVENNAQVAFVTHTGRNIVTVPVVYAPEQFLSALNSLGLGQAVMNATGNITIEATDTEYLSARASLLTPEVSDAELGIKYVNSSYLPDVTDMLFTYTDSEDVLRQQVIYPAPIDNTALQGLANTVSIYMDGRVVAKNSSGQTEYSGLLGYNIYQAVAQTSDNISIQEIEDVNQDGLLDYRLIYPNGDAQVMYRVE
ncbi:Calx-beta domain-containing protein [Candidatus Albibeggiatoa sp. nov. BB20]|uniref:Calx-beta domain-containing protein n=1 Tax=Candidatus Albibeggiatoa sp. nov. BB20 TaxID=3162723 RepID=UPI0033655323